MIGRYCAAAIICSVLFLPTMARADRHPGWHGQPPPAHLRGPGPRYPGYGHPDHWHRGHWYHGHHGGRHGWWWIVGGAWHWYPAPVYPYPAPLVAVPIPAAPLPAGTWYYCADPPGYYPHVPACNGPWQVVQSVP